MLHAESIGVVKHITAERLNNQRLTGRRYPCVEFEQACYDGEEAPVRVSGINRKRLQENRRGS